MRASPDHNLTSSSCYLRGWTTFGRNPISSSINWTMISRHWKTIAVLSEIAFPVAATTENIIEIFLCWSREWFHSPMLLTGAIRWDYPWAFVAVMTKQLDLSESHTEDGKFKFNLHKGSFWWASNEIYRKFLLESFSFLIQTFSGSTSMKSMDKLNI